MKIVSLDFETANSSRGSVCSVGIALLEDSKILDSKEWLIKPHGSCAYFDFMNISIHGITARDVRNSPEFNKIFTELCPLFEYADAVVAHNAAFDISVLRNTLDLYNIDYPEFDYLCTYKAATKVWPDLHNHKLNTVSDHIGHKFRHHNAKEDAEAAGKALLSMMETNETDSIHDFSKSIGMKIGKLFKGGYKACSVKKNK